MAYIFSDAVFLQKRENVVIFNEYLIEHIHWSHAHFGAGNEHGDDLATSPCLVNHLVAHVVAFFLETELQGSVTWFQQFSQQSIDLFELIHKLRMNPAFEHLRQRHTQPLAILFSRLAWRSDFDFLQKVSIRLKSFLQTSNAQA